MTDAEKAIVLEVVADVEKLLPEIAAAESAKLPEPYAPLVQGVIAAIGPQLIAAMDSALKAKLGLV